MLQGDTVVMVEHRSGSTDAYGQGKKVPMALREFIARMQKGDSNLYLSTQEVRSLGNRPECGSVQRCVCGRWAGGRRAGQLTWREGTGGRGMGGGGAGATDMPHPARAVNRTHIVSSSLGMLAVQQLSSPSP